MRLVGQAQVTAEGQRGLALHLIAERQWPPDSHLLHNTAKTL